MALKKYLILIIDDDPINLGVVFDFLENYGFKIIAARNGEMGLIWAQFALPDIILLSE